MEASNINLLVGASYNVSLEGRGGAGYCWEHEIVGPTGIVSVGVGSSSAPTVGNHGGPPPSLAPVATEFTVTGLKSGRVSLIFTLSRPWQKDGAPLGQRIVDITVL